METAIKRLNAIEEERESMINYLLSLKEYRTDAQYDKAYFALKSKGYRLLKTQYDNAIKKMFG